jgi:DNA-binding beta-propeller fold protein YncE
MTQSPHRRRLRVLCLVTALLPAAPASALQITGLQRPESFLVDPSGSSYFITNANGDPDLKDNNGFITKLDADGKLLKLHFIRGGEHGVVLHAPKGMAIVRDTLYVADLEAVRGFDTRTGRPVVTVAFPSPDAKLADVTADEEGQLYVSEPDADTIYRIDAAHGHAVTVFVRDAALAGPRGLAFHPKTGRLIVASWKKGKILEVDAGGAVTVLASNSFFSHRFHNLDGVDFDTYGNMYVSDFTAGKVWRMRPDRRFDVIAEFLPYPADIGVDRKKHLILVPYHYGDAAEMNGLESPVKKDSKKRTFADYGFDFKKPPLETK